MKPSLLKSNYFKFLMVLVSIYLIITIINRGIGFGRWLNNYFN